MLEEPHSRRAFLGAAALALLAGWSPDGRTVASAGGDGRLRLFGVPS